MDVNFSNGAPTGFLIFKTEAFKEVGLFKNSLILHHIL